MWWKPCHKEKDLSVRSCCYDGQWIKSAWGKDGIQAFLTSLGRNIRPRVKVALGLHPIQPGMIILDVGCGRGEVVIYAAKKGAEAHGVDYSKDVIALGRQVVEYLPAEQRERIHLHNADVKSIPWEEGTFDIIYLLDIIEHLHDWELDALFTRIRCILKPQGLIIIHTLPNRWLYDITYRAVRTMLPFLPRDPRGELERKIHVNEQTILSIHSLLERHGLFGHVCITEQLGRQALWYAREKFGDKRDQLYRLLRKPMVRGLLSLIEYLPVKILLLNDIYAVAARSREALPSAPFPGCAWERILISLASWQRRRRHCQTSAY